MKKPARPLREKPSLPSALMQMAARLPWWLGLALAAISYIGLHHVAQQPMPAAPQPGQMGRFLLSAAAHGLALAGQYLLPAFFAVGALVSAFRRGKAVRLYSAASTRTEALGRMSWQEFEILVGEYFRRQGFGVLDNGGGGADGGVDVVLHKTSGKGKGSYLVQCKHWRALRVGVQPVRELYGVMAAHGAAGGFVVTSGDFTEEAVRFADGLALTLVNGRTLMRDIQAHKASGPAGLSAPGCPLCGAAMVLRQARSGSAAGKQFWGCSRYAQDRCRGTREVD